MSAPLPEDLSRLLAEWSGGDRKALDELMPLVYQELRRLAHRHLAQERRTTKEKFSWWTAGQTGLARCFPPTPRNISQFVVSKDDRMIYFGVSTEEADVWLMSLD